MQSMNTVRAVDIGYGNTKFVVNARGDHIDCDLLPSRAPLRQRCAMGGDGAISGRRNELIEVDGQLYEVGPDTELFKGPPILHEGYTTTPEYLALYRAALGRMQAPHIDVMITGLPVSHLAQKKDLLVKRMNGKHPVGNGRYVNVAQVHVYAQPLGGLVDHILLRRGGWDEKENEIIRLLIDPGFYTIDWVVAKGLKELPGLSGSYSCGVSQVLQAIAQRISEDTGYPFEQLPKLDRALRLGALELRGKTIDLARYADLPSSIWANALTAMINNVGDGADFDEVYLVGGGAKLLQPAVAKLFSNHPLKMADNSIFANVRGFQKIGQVFTRQSRVA